MKRKIIFFSLLLTLTATNLWADGVEVDLIEGGTVIPVQNDNIRMVSEEVRMYGDIKVTANFIFENLSNKPVVMKMGFPVPSAKDFKVWIQGAPATVDKRRLGGKDEIVFKNSGGFKLDAYVWDISFAAGEKKNVNVEYNGQWAVPIDGHPYTYFIYVTKSGALWKGTIGKADFYLELTEYLARLVSNKKYNFKLSIRPEGYKIRDSETDGYTVKNGLIEWHFVNWKPTENIGVAVVEDDDAIRSFLELLRLSEEFDVTASKVAAGEQEEVQKWTRYFKKKIYDGDRRRYTLTDIEKWKEQSSAVDEPLQRVYVKALRNEIYARHGRIFSTQEMKQIFESAPWYRPRTDFKESDLNDIEKENVEYIYKYEKKMSWK